MVQGAEGSPEAGELTVDAVRAHLDECGVYEQVADVTVRPPTLEVMVMAAPDGEQRPEALDRVAAAIGMLPGVHVVTTWHIDGAAWVAARI